MKIFLGIVGVLVLLLGLHWIGQGTGYFSWPHGNPVMDNHIEWAYYGIAAAIAGLIIIAYSRRRSR